MEVSLAPDPSRLDDLVRRILAVVQPCRIVLFGSAARGEMHADSDLDVLVVMPVGTHRGRTTEAIYRGMWGFGFAKDIVVVTEDDELALKDDPSSVVHAALTEGKVLHEAA
jgi:UTP:GlnB (protein PII) uridylyltransferase